YVPDAGRDKIEMFRRAPDGALTRLGCIADNDSATACAQTTDGLDAALDLVISRDGADVYVTGIDDDAVVHMHRDAGGLLTPVDCIDDDDTGPEPCAQSTGGLDRVEGIAISPDGKSVYTSSDGDHAVARFNRASDGALTP